MPALGPCPPADLLGRYLADDLPADAVGPLEGHLESCPGCAGRLGAALAADPLLPLAAGAGDGPAGRHAPRAARVAPPSAAPADAGRVGGYRVLRVLGRGGMGVVYLARDGRLGREVAVKVVRDRFRGDPGMARRFVAEARITGRLQHPGVPPVHDLGELPDGSPYMAMKLIAGRTLAALLAERPDPGHDRGRFVAVFHQVCQAVGFAHNSGVVHRDLKPGNVMVGDFGEVQVMDWGLAKVLAGGGRRPEAGADHRADAPRPVGDDPDATTAPSAPGADDRTRAGEGMGTPGYMPPEQAKGEWDRVDARADVFALGGILCEVLTGRPPYAGGAAGEVLRRAQAAELGPALERLDGCGADAELVDLCVRCLSAEPTDRPADGGAVAAEVGGYLAGVEARLRRAERDAAAAEAKAEEQRKRRRVQLALAGAVGLVLLGAGAVAWREDRRATADRGRRDQNAAAMAESLTRCEVALGEDDADRAGAALAEAEQRAGEPGGDALADRLVRCRADLAMLLDIDRVAALQWTDEGEPRRPAATSSFVQVITSEIPAAFARYGVPTGAGPTEAIARRVNDSRIRTRLLTGLDLWLGASRSGEVLDVLRAVDPDPYRTAFREAVAARSPGLHELLGRPDALGQPAWFAVQLTRVGGLSPRRVGVVLRAVWNGRTADFNVAMALSEAVPDNQADGAAEREMWLRTALAIRPRSAIAWTRLGTALRDKGDSPGAIAAHREAIRLAPDNPTFRYNLGNAQRAVKDMAAAIESYRAAVRANPAYAEAHHNLGNALRETDPRAAVQCYREAVRLDPQYRLAHFMLGVALEQTGDLDGAVAAFRKAVNLNVDDADAHRRLGQLLRRKRNFDGAVAAYREALRLDPDHAPTHSYLGRALSDLGRVKEAEAAQREALRHDPKSALAHDGLSIALKDKGDLAGAVAAAREAIRHDPKMADAYINLGVALRDLRKPREAAAAHREAIRLDPSNALAQYNLGVALAELRDIDGAVACYRETIRLDPTIPSAHNNLGSILVNRGEVDAAITCYREAVRLRPDRADYKRNLQVAQAFQASRSRKPPAVAPPPREVKR